MGRINLMPFWFWLVLVSIVVVGSESLPYSSESGVQVLGVEAEIDLGVGAAQVEVAYWEAGVIQQPTYFDGLVRLSVLSWKYGDLSRAYDYYWRALEVDPNRYDLELVERLVFN